LKIYLTVDMVNMLLYGKSRDNWWPNLINTGKHTSIKKENKSHELG